MFPVTEPSSLVALRIHISLEMKKALDAVGGFKIERRGLVDVKVQNIQPLAKSIPFDVI